MGIQVIQLDKVDVLEPYTYEAAAIEAAGGTLVLSNCTTEAEMIAAAQDAEIALVARADLPVTAHVMRSLPRLRYLMRWGVGYDGFDVESATALGIAIGNAPAYGSEEVAEHTIALLMACARRIGFFHVGMKAGSWPPARKYDIHRMTGRTLGLLGAGRIGSAVGRRAVGLGLRVLACDPFLSDDAIRARGLEPATIDDVVAKADYLSVHVPFSPATRHTVNAGMLQRMKPGAMLINTSRGGVIDTAALVDALQRGHLGGAGLDVFEVEPLAADHPLRAMDTVVLTPHVASASIEAMPALRQEMATSIVEWIREGWSKNVVNPQVRANLRPRLA